MANPYGKYRLHLKNFRAIEEADITLDGITVVAGINACGKSTISRLFYETFRCSNEFRKIAFAEFDSRYEKIREDVASFLYYYQGFEAADNWKRSNKSKTEPAKKDNAGWVFRRISKEKSFVDIVAEAIKAAEKIKFVPELGIFGNRLARALAVYKYKETGSEKQEDLRQTLLKLEADYRKEYNEIEKRAQVRDFEIYKQKIIELFSQYNDNGESLWCAQTIFELWDDDGLITDKENQTLAPILGIEDVFYCDTPHFYLTPQKPTPMYYRAIKRVLFEEERRLPRDSRLEELNAEFLRFARGNAVVRKVFGETQVNYERPGEAPLPMQNCATGLKSVGLLQMLMNKGALTETTAVFLDEPEAYLHPEWIVEYARMLVLINKTLGTRFFIATHNPDMTSAIRYISEKEGTLDSVNFYIAEESPTSKYQFRYKEAKEDDKNIEPLFKSFARGLDKIDEYSDNNIWIEGSDE